MGYLADKLARRNAENDVAPSFMDERYGRGPWTTRARWLAVGLALNWLALYQARMPTTPATAPTPAPREREHTLATWRPPPLSLMPRLDLMRTKYSR